MITAREGTQCQEGAMSVSTASESVAKNDPAEKAMSEQELKEVRVFCFSVFTCMNLHQRIMMKTIRRSGGPQGA